MKISPERLTTNLFKVCSRSAFALFVLLIISGCGSESSSSLDLTPPEKMRNISAIDFTAVYAEITVNNGAAQRFNFNNSGSRSLAVNGVILDEDNDIRIVWFQTIDGQPIELARQVGTFFGDSQTRNANIDLAYDDSADSNGNGISDLDEIIAGTFDAGGQAQVRAPTMIAIPSGTLRMGSDVPDADANEGPEHSVLIDAFKLADSEVTWNDWNACVDAGGCESLEGPDWLAAQADPGRHPVTKVNWNQIQSYITWINATLPGTYRLPTEAEFEYALRAGSSTEFSFGDDETNFCDFENGSKSSEDCDDGYPRSSPVKTFMPNLFGLYDMNGNAEEWTQDCWHDNYIGAPTSGIAWVEPNCPEGVLRGGNHLFVPNVFRSSNRRKKTRASGFAEDQEGFRLASD